MLLSVDVGILRPETVEALLPSSGQTGMVSEIRGYEAVSDRLPHSRKMVVPVLPEGESRTTTFCNP